MTQKEKITGLIYKAIDEFNEITSSESRLEKDEQKVIFGMNGKLDSLGLVNFIVILEEILEQEFPEIEIILADENAISQRESPFKSVETLSNYIIKILNDGSAS